MFYRKSQKGGMVLKVEGYSGICSCCFRPIEEGKLFRFREKGRNFHKGCPERNPNNYYVKLEKRLAQKALDKRKEV